MAIPVFYATPLEKLKCPIYDLGDGKVQGKNCLVP